MSEMPERIWAGMRPADPPYTGTMHYWNESCLGEEYVRGDAVDLLIAKALEDFAERVHLPIVAELEAENAKTHAEIRASYDKCIADSWRAKVAELEAALEDATNALETALEHSAHAWARGHHALLDTTDKGDTYWPPQTSGFKPGMEAYHWAAVIGAVKGLYDRLKAKEKENP